MIELFMVWSLATTIFYALLNKKGEPINNSIDFELGYIVGSKDSQIHGKQPIEDVEAYAIRNWHRVKNSMVVDLKEFSLGYISGWCAYESGII